MSYQPPQNVPPQGEGHIGQSTPLAPPTQAYPAQQYPPTQAYPAQQYPPSQAYPAQYGMPAASAPEAKGPRRRGLLIAGSAILLAGLIGGGALAATSGSTYESAVKDMARAPVGCTTTLDFEATGDFNLFIETTGSTADLRGDCAGSDATYDRSADDLPDVDLALTDADDRSIDLDRNEDASYDAGGFVGTSVRSFTIDEPGTYKLLVTSDEDGFAVSVGKDPQADADGQRNLGIGLAALAVLIGGPLLLLGLRRKKSVPTPTGPAWGQASTAPGWPPQPGGQPSVTGQPVWAPQPAAPPAPYAPAPPAPPAWPQQPTWQQQPAPPPEQQGPPPGWGAPQQ